MSKSKGICYRNVYQYTLTGELVGVHKGPVKAGEAIGKRSHAISECCAGRLRTAYGYLWLRSNDPAEVTGRLSLVHPQADEALEGEEWRDVVGFEGIYKISNLGRVKRLPKIVKKKDGRVVTYKEKLLSPHISRGYYLVNLYGRSKQLFLVHRLIAEAFIPNPNKLPFIDHINTISSDNRIENLRWCTAMENSHNPITISNRAKLFQKRVETGFYKNANLHRKPVEMLDEDGNVIQRYRSIKEAADNVGVAYSAISNVCAGRARKCKKHYWRYAN